MRNNQAGATIVEFAVISVVFLTILLAIMDFGRILFTWNAVAEATRYSARMSVVCAQSSKPAVVSGMQNFVSNLSSSNVTINWYDNTNAISTTCDATNCTGVTVGIGTGTATPLTIQPVSPLGWIGFSSLTVPPFSTYLPREIMGQDAGSGSICN